MASVALSYETLSDIELARRIAQRDFIAAGLVIKRNNQRLYRAAWSVLKDRWEAEEAVQDGYLKAFAAIGSFAGKSSLSTWLTRIVLNEALGRRRSAQRRSRQLREQSVAIIEEYREKLMAGSNRRCRRKPTWPGIKSQSFSRLPSRICRRNSGWSLCFATLTVSASKRLPKCFRFCLKPSRRVSCGHEGGYRLLSNQACRMR